MKTPKLFLISLCLLMTFYACRPSENAISPSENSNISYDFLPQVPYCECSNIQKKEIISTNKPKVLRQAWGENIIDYEYDDKGRLVKERGYISAPDIGTVPHQLITYEYANSSNLSKKNIFQAINEKDSTYKVISTAFNLVELIEYEYNGNLLISEKHQFLRGQIYDLTRYQYDCKGNLIGISKAKDLYNNLAAGADPATVSFFKYDCSGNIAKEYRRTEIRTWQKREFETLLIAHRYNNNLLISTDIHNENSKLIRKEIYQYDKQENLIEIISEDYESYKSTVLERRNYINNRLVEIIKNPNDPYPLVTRFEY